MATLPHGGPGSKLKRNINHIHQNLLLIVSLINFNISFTTSLAFDTFQSFHSIKTFQLPCNHFLLLPFGRIRPDLTIGILDDLDLQLSSSQKRQIMLSISRLSYNLQRDYSSYHCHESKPAMVISLFSGDSLEQCIPFTSMVCISLETHIVFTMADLGDPL